MKRALDRLLDRCPDIPVHAATLGWTLLFIALAWFDSRASHQQQIEFARAEARAACRTDLAYNRWIAGIGGIYAPISPSLPPVERLTNNPGRDALTRDGRELTLINPGCMVQAVHSQTQPDSGIHAHIIGAQPTAAGSTSGPATPPSPFQAWSIAALRDLAAGKSEVYDVTNEGGTNIFRYMAGLTTQDACLKCHADQGFRTGELRGGIRIDVPLNTAGFVVSQRQHDRHLAALLGIWAIGVAGIQGTAHLARRRRLEREQTFQDLAQREERYRSVIESTPDGFWLVDHQGRILEVNEVYVQRSGYSREELLQRRISDLEALETPEITARRMESLRREGSAIFDTAHRAKDGSVWPVEAKVTHSKASGHFAAFLRDLSRHNRSEALLRIRGRLADLAQSASIDDTLQAALDEAERLTGSSIGFYHFVGPDQETLTLQTWSTNTLRHMCSAEGKGQHYPVSQAGVWVECLRAGKPVIHNDYASLPNRRGLPPGHAPVIRELVVPVLRGGRAIAVMGVGNNPNPYGTNDTEIVEAIAGMVTDLVLRKRAQDELSRFFELVPDLVCIADTTGAIRQMNPAWERTLGLPVATLRSQPFTDLVHPADRQATLRTFVRIVRGIAVQGHLNRLRASDGAYRWIEWNAVSIGGENLVFAAARDVTDRVHAQQLAELQATLGIALASGKDPKEILQFGLSLAIRASDTECGGLYLRDPETDNLILTAHHNLSPAFVRDAHCYAAHSSRGRVVLRGETIQARYADLFPDTNPVHSAEGLRAIAIVGIRHETQIVGCVNVASRTTDEITPGAMARLESLVPQLGSVIARLRAEEALRESERRLRLLFEGATDAIFWADAASGLLTDCNHAAETLLGHPRAGIIGRPLSFAHPPSEVERCANAFRTICNGGPLQPFETEILRADGTRRQVLISPSRTRVGGFTVIQGIFHDISERKRAENELLRHQNLLEAIFDHSPFMMCLVDPKGRIERMNRSMARLAADPATALPGTFIGDVVGCTGAVTPAAERDHSPVCQACVLRRTLNEGVALGKAPQRFEFSLTTLRHGRQEELRLAASTALVPIGGEQRFLVCLEDITSRKQLERQFLQAQKMEAVGQLAGGVAHDFNNIIGATMMHLHLLLDTPGLDPDLKVALRELEGETRRAANLTRQLLLFGRREVAQIRRVNANEIIEGLLKMLRRLLGEHIDITFTPSPVPPCVEADPGMLEQVIMNLCVNARDAMPKGGPLRISTAPHDVTPDMARLSLEARVGSFVRLTVEDSGTGIDPETLNHIFEPFFTTKAAGKGTGLGLATVYGIVRQHQGWIEVQSTLDLGTSFHVFLPASTAAPAIPAPEGVASLPRGTETILVVEDDASLLKTSALLLRVCGYRVLEARNGPEALTVWQDSANQVHALFTDIVMPGGISGLDLAETLRRSKPGLRILMASGYSADLINAGGKPGEHISFLTKPYTPAALAHALRQCLDTPSPQV